MAYTRHSTAVIVAPVFVNGVCVLRQMARKGAYVVAVDCKGDQIGFSSRYVKERVVLPRPQERSDAFAEWLLSRRDLYGAIVIPTDDYYVRELHSHREELEKHYRLAVSPGDSTAIALDKAWAYREAAAAGVPIPKTVDLDGASDLAEAAAYVGFPAILRAAFSLAFAKEFHTKCFRVESLEELKERFKTASASGHAMMLQEVIPGGDELVVSAKFYADGSGEILGIVPGVKVLQYPPIFGIGQLQESRDIPQVSEWSVRLLKHIRFRGSIGAVEWKYDEREATWKFLEINARSLMSVRFLKMAGVDALEMLWRDKLGLPQLPPPKIRYGRRWTYIKDGLLRHKAYPEHRKTLREYLRLYRPPLCFALLDLSDPKPFICDIMPMLRRRITHQ